MTSFFQPRLGHKWWHKLLHLFFIVYAVYVAAKGVWGILGINDHWMSEMSEMLDNYAGGFVRRGLFGEVAIWLHHAVGLHPFALFVAVTLVSYAVLLCYFVWQFRRRGLCWYFLATCLMLGSFGVYGVMMRRMFLVVLFLCVVQLLKRARTWVALVLGNALTIVGLLCYEPYFFFSVPMFIALTHALSRSWRRACAVWLPSVAVFLVCCVCHGNPEQFALMKAEAVAYVGSNTVLLDFIQWSALDMVKLHIELNYLSAPCYVPAVFVNVVALAYALYVSTNGVLAFEKPSDENRRARRTLFSLVAFQMFTQLPMFIILSTDYGRICCFSVATAYIVYFTFDGYVLARLFPLRVQGWADRACDRMNSCLVPSRTLLVAMFLFVGISSWQGHIGRMLQASMAGSFAQSAWHLLKHTFLQ